MIKFKLVVATRLSEDDFFNQTATGKCLRNFQLPFVEIRLFSDNSQGLPVAYNIAIDESKNDPCILIFMHDDIHILDYFWLDQVYTGLQQFGVIGVAGCKQRTPYRPGWIYPSLDLVWDNVENLSGVIGHGKQFPPSLSMYGLPKQQVQLLDGVFLCSHSETLIKNGIKFDDRFDFHFYDLDFCRQLDSAGISMGTWTISLMHESEGYFGGDDWLNLYDKYIEKWGS